LDLAGNLLTSIELTVAEVVVALQTLARMISPEQLRIIDQSHCCALPLKLWNAVSSDVTILIYCLQYCFLKCKSTATQLLVVYHEILDRLADGKDVGVIHLDLSKAFDKVPPLQLLPKLENYGILGPALEWTICGTDLSE
jgi:hypothetical protein